MSGPYRIIQGNALNVLKTLDTESVDCCVTSSPYWGLRSYGTEPQTWGGLEDCAHEWGDAIRTPWANDVPGPNGARKNGPESRYKPKETGPFCQLCSAWRGELGLEPTPELFVSHLVLIFREVRRVLKPQGTLWANIGDCYATGAGAVGECPGGGGQGERFKEQWGYRGGHTDSPKHAMKQVPDTKNPNANIPTFQPNRMPIAGLKPKDLVMIPARFALALQADGWWLRQDNIWAKKNCMPESVEDRCTTSHEHVFHFAKSERYYYDHTAIMEPLTTAEGENYPARARITGRADQGFAAARGGDRGKSGGFPPSKRSGNKERKFDVETRSNNHQGSSIPWEGNARNHRSVWNINTRPFAGAHFAVMPEELAETCILAGCPGGGIVLDPFAGSGTVGVVALRHGRDFLGIELNPKYVRLAHRRIFRAAPLTTASPEISMDEALTDLPLFAPEVQ